MMDKIHVMIVDDDLEDAGFLITGFEQQAVAAFFTLCPSGEDAISWLNRTEIGKYPDVIFMDMHMPGMSGFQAIEIIKKIPAARHIPVMIISSSMSDAQQGKCEVAGCAKCFMKPMSLEEYRQTAADTIAYIARNVADIVV